jgi:GAF domain-containing protein
MEATDPITQAGLITENPEVLATLVKIGEEVNASLDLETVLATIVAKAVQLSGTEAGAIYVFAITQSGGHFVHAINTGIKSSFGATTLAVSNGRLLVTISRARRGIKVFDPTGSKIRSSIRSEITCSSCSAS